MRPLYTFSQCVEVSTCSHPVSGKPMGCISPPCLQWSVKSHHNHSIMDLRLTPSNGDLSGA